MAYIRTPEIREKIRRAKLGKKLSIAHRAAISEGLIGRIQSEECKRKIGLANKISHARLETKIKKSKAIIIALNEPSVRRRHLAAIKLRDKKHGKMFRGGKGCAPILFVRNLAKILEPVGFVREYPVSLGSPIGGCYSLDFAHVEAKIDIECDGKRHRQWRQQKKDAIRDTYLKNLGWRIIRVPHD